MARSRVRKRPQALRDLSDIAFYLAEETGIEELAFRFLDSAEASFERLAAMPEMGSAREFRSPALTQVRMWRVTGFDNYLIFYRPVENGIEIVRVLHAKRDIGSLL